MSFANSQTNAQSPSNIIWSKLSAVDLQNFSTTMELALDLINIPACILHGECLCFDSGHLCQIEQYFIDILRAIEQADAALPRSCFRALKPFWSKELTILKRKSFLSHKAWLDQDKPTNGPVYEAYTKCRSDYRTLLRQEKRKKEGCQNDKLYEALIDKDQDEFWRTWKSLSQSGDPLATRIDGNTQADDIAERFSNVFSDIYENNDVTAHAKLKDRFMNEFPAYFSAHKNDNISCFFFTRADIIDMVDKLKLRKSYAGFVRTEHISNGSPKLMFHLHILFNSMLQHGYLPTYFLRGSITPLVKNRDGDVTDSTNYRAITLSPIFMQMYEMLEKSKFGYFLKTDDRQFGFKPGVSTNHAIYSLKKTADYFTNNGSRVYLGFLDCSKAFDRISHWGLFIKLMERNVPLCFLMSVIYLYCNMSCTVKWKSVHGRVFDITTGTKQGGILSPDFFSLYINDLISLLTKCGYGSSIIGLVISCLFFADDIVLISPSRYGLQQMLDICFTYCSEFCLDFNVSKSKIMILGNELSEGVFAPLNIDSPILDYVDEFK